MALDRAIETKILENQNGYIKIAAMDHRGSLKKMIPEDQMSDFKKLLVETFSPYNTAILIDPLYGKPAIETAKNADISILLSREQTGYEDTEDGRTTQLLEDFNSAKLKEMGADAVKLLLYYNPNAENRADQLDIVRKVREETVNENIPFLIEPITYKVEGYEYNLSDAILQTVEDLTLMCDILKLEYPIEVAEDGSNIEDAKDILEEISGKSTVPWVLLSHGMQFENYKKALQVSKDAGCSGYAVGRAVWQEVKDLETWEEIEDFIKSTAVDRMQQLSDIYE